MSTRIEEENQRGYPETFTLSWRPLKILSLSANEFVAASTSANSKYANLNQTIIRMAIQWQRQESHKREQEQNEDRQVNQVSENTPFGVTGKLIRHDCETVDGATTLEVSLKLLCSGAVVHLSSRVEEHSVRGLFQNRRGI